MGDPKAARKGDPFLVQYQPSELQIASEFLTTWLPFLSRDLCQRCTRTLSDRIRSLELEVHSGGETLHSDQSIVSRENCCDENCDQTSTGSCRDGDDTNSLGSWKDGANRWSESPTLEASTSGILGKFPNVETPPTRMSWADMAQEDELMEEEEQQEYDKRVVDISPGTGELRISKVVGKPQLSREQREYIRFMNVKRKKDFICLERVKGRIVNILKGLELHTGIFSAAEQKRIVDFIYQLQEMGKRGELKDRTYSAPQKWMRGKGRVTIQFGCCYNYAVDKNGNPPGILQNETVDPIPPLFKVIIKRLVRWHVIPPTCVPDSCIVNIYAEGDCIPPHIDNHDFVRPFCTVSFVSECDIVFGSNLKALGPGVFAGSVAIPLPLGSVLVLNGNGADVAKHCVPSVPTKRISITFRRMDETKRPNEFVPEPDLQDIQPLSYEEDTENLNSPKSERYMRRQPNGKDTNVNARGFAESGSRPRFQSHGRRGSEHMRRFRVNMGN